jgi:hypothetical protein
MFKARKDYTKTNKVVDSCDTFQQLNTAMNMVYNYGKMYNYNHYWTKLDKKSFGMYMHHLDMVEIKERNKEIEQETSTNTEG